jgi:hypothetical protein
MSLVESVPLQQKIAELEGRIEKLEKEHGVVFTRTTITSLHSPGDGAFGDGWEKMWQGFNEMMKAAFK